MSARRLTPEVAAHILRRLTFGPFPRAVERALERHRTADDLVDALFNAPPIPLDPPESIDVPHDPNADSALGHDSVVVSWIGRMTSDEAGVHERMMWFWHTVFTTAYEDIAGLLLWLQFRTLHTHALGTVGGLANAMVVDGAMLQYLDGDKSEIFSPNENLGRELMELFLLGAGHYTEADVRAAARSLSGWRVDPMTGVAELAPVLGPSAPDTFLGRTTVFNTRLVVETILAQPHCAEHLVTRLWRYFVGGAPDGARVVEWSDRLRSGDYAIAPVVEEIVHSKEFLGARLSRPRTGIEWYAAHHRACGVQSVHPPTVRELGQCPFDPPNVAGWPNESSWLSGAVQIARAAYVETAPMSPAALELGPGAARRALHWCGVFEASERTVSALQHLANRVPGPEEYSRAVLLRATVMSPEFGVA